MVPTQDGQTGWGQEDTSRGSQWVQQRQAATGREGRPLCTAGRQPPQANASSRTHPALRKAEEVLAAVALAKVFNQNTQSTSSKRTRPPHNGSPHLHKTR